MKKDNRSIIVFIIISLITFIFIVYGSELSTETVLSTNAGTKLIVKKSNSFIEYSSEDNVFIIDEEDIIYISPDILSEHLNTKAYFDPEDKIAIITTLDKVIRFYGETFKVKINNDEVDYIKPMIISDGVPLIPITQIKEYLNLETVILEENNRIIIRSLYDSEVVGEAVYSKIVLKKDKSMWSEIVEVLDSDNNIKIVGEDDGWLRVFTNHGSNAFIKKNRLKNFKEIEGIEMEVSSSIWRPENDKILLTWESVYSKNPDTRQIKEMDGLNVISPTWIELRSSSGNIKSNVSKSYINWAKKRGYKVWALFSNSFDPKLTDKFLNNSVAREKTIDRLLKLLKENNMDGINIDFENVYLKNKELLVQFVRELTPIFHENGLVVSIDVTVIGGSDNWSNFLDRKALGKVVDYMAVMTYDEHWATSPKSGSVASIGWVERGIERILEEVPAEKLLLGVPFYTRIWTEIPSSANPDKVTVKSKAISMKVARKILGRDDITKVWDEEAGQYYISYVENNKLNKIWFEDAKSIKLKTDLVKKFNLAGVAAWRRGFETEEIWSTIDSNINEK
ncbi:glycosyl hydrolase family 18 protein [Wukongibacter sp. M2B1]|uniref:glycosyl hydrolase family 18 protein n=1 Tax=Wukongibacter sp. M2B1 TaxID=3088895 RepID=UPI003D7B570C